MRGGKVTRAGLVPLRELRERIKTDETSECVFHT